MQGGIEHQIEYFRGKHRVIAFDLPGHGMSDNGDPEKTYNVIAYADVAEDVLRRWKSRHRRFLAGHWADTSNWSCRRGHQKKSQASPLPARHP